MLTTNDQREAALLEAMHTQSAAPVAQPIATVPHDVLVALHYIEACAVRGYNAHLRAHPDAAALTFADWLHELADGRYA